MSGVGLWVMVMVMVMNDDGDDDGMMVMAIVVLVHPCICSHIYYGMVAFVQCVLHDPNNAKGKVIVGSLH